MDCKKEDERQNVKKNQKKITTTTTTTTTIINKASVSFFKKKKPIIKTTSTTTTSQQQHPVIHRQRSFHSQEDDDMSPRMKNGSSSEEVVSTFCTEEEIFDSIFMIQSPKRDRTMPTTTRKKKVVISSPRCFQTSSDNVTHHPNVPFHPDFASPLGRWKFQSHVATNHAQNPYHLDLSHRYFPISVLPYGIPPHTASKLTHFTYHADSFGEHELPFFLDTISKLFPNLSNLNLLSTNACSTSIHDVDIQSSFSGSSSDMKLENDDDDVQKSCMKRLYILFRLPNLICLNSIPVTNEEREMARPSYTKKQRINKVHQWLSSKSNVPVSNISNKSCKQLNHTNNDPPSSPCSNRSVLLLTNKHNNNNNSPIIVAQRDSNPIQRKNSSSPLSIPVLSSDDYSEHPTTPKQIVQTAEQENEENMVLVSPSSSNQMYSPSRNRHHHPNTKAKELPFMQPIHELDKTASTVTPNDGTKSPLRHLHNTNTKRVTKYNKKSSALMIPGEKETLLPRNKDIFSLQPRSYNPITHDFLSQTPKIQMKQTSKPPPAPSTTSRNLPQTNKHHSKRNKIVKDRFYLNTQKITKPIFDNLDDEDDDEGEFENQDKSNT